MATTSRTQLAPDQLRRDTQKAPVGGKNPSQLAPDQARYDTQGRPVGGKNLSELTPDQAANDTHRTFVGGKNPSQLAPDQTLRDAQEQSVGGEDLAVDQGRIDTQARRVNGKDLSELAPDQAVCDTQTGAVGGENLVVDQDDRDTQWLAVSNNGRLPTNDDPIPMPAASGAVSYSQMDMTDLMLWSESLDDLEGLRIQLENRIRAAEDGNISVDVALYALLLGQELADLLISEGGMRADDGHVYKRLAARAKTGVKGEENYATKHLELAVKRHLLGPWIEAQKGVGLKQAGRLLGALGDPYIRAPEYEGVDEKAVEVAPARPRRGPAELWAYCGYHTVSAGDQARCDAQLRSVPGGNVAPRHVRGQQGNWNDAARMRAYLISESCIKTSGPLREVYDQGRERYADAVHDSPCVRCGPSGKPAPVGSPLSAGHQYKRALRLVAKEVLKGFFNEAKRLHQLAPDQASPDTQERPVGGENLA